MWNRGAALVGARRLAHFSVRLEIEREDELGRVLLVQLVIAIRGGGDRGHAGIVDGDGGVAVLHGKRGEENVLDGLGERFGVHEESQSVRGTFLLDQNFLNLIQDVAYARLCGTRAALSRRDGRVGAVLPDDRFA